MKKPAVRLCLAISFMSMLAVWVSAQAVPGVTGAGLGTFTASTAYSGIALSGLDFGMGFVVPGDTSASGELHATLQGTAGQAIRVDGRASAGSILADGSATISGTTTVDKGDGSAPSTGVTFTLRVVPNNTGSGT